jgi:hypothetical protein
MLSNISMLAHQFYSLLSNRVDIFDVSSSFVGRGRGAFLRGWGIIGW